MDAKWNWLIDNVGLRAMINTAVFALWVAASIGILEIAANLKSVHKGSNRSLTAARAKDNGPVHAGPCAF